MNLIRQATLNNEYMLASLTWEAGISLADFLDDIGIPYIMMHNALPSEGVEILVDKHYSPIVGEFFMQRTKFSNT